MKKGVSLALAPVLALGLTTYSTDGGDTRSTGSPSPAMENPAAGTEAPSTPEAVTIASLSADKETIELEVPYDPQRIAILDMTSLDILDALGAVGGRVAGSADTSPDYLQSYVTDENMASPGATKTADLEAATAAQPDVIFISNRLAKSYDALSGIVLVVYFATDNELGVTKNVRQNAATIASVFDLEDKVDELMADFDTRIRTLADFAADKTAVVGMCTSDGLNVLGNNDRCSIIGREIGFENVGVDAGIDTSAHGNEASFESVVKKDPDYVFVMDRGAAIQADDTQLAQETMENELVMGTGAYKSDNIIYLAHPAIWYIAEGGITALDIMLQDLEDKLLG